MLVRSSPGYREGRNGPWQKAFSQCQRLAPRRAWMLESGAVILGILSPSPRSEVYDSLRTNVQGHLSLSLSLDFRLRACVYLSSLTVESTKMREVTHLLLSTDRRAAMVHRKMSAGSGSNVRISGPCLRLRAKPAQESRQFSPPRKEHRGFVMSLPGEKTSFTWTLPVVPILAEVSGPNTYPVPRKRGGVLLHRCPWLSDWKFQFGSLAQRG